MRRQLILTVVVLGCACAPAQQIAPNQIGPTASGDVLYGSGGGTARLPIGSVGYVLGVSSSNLPYWSPLQSLGGPPIYQSASCSYTASSSTTAVNLNVTSGDLLVVLATDNAYSVSAPNPSYPTIADNQSNTWFQDAQSSATYVGGTGISTKVFHAFAKASGTVTVTTTGLNPTDNQSQILIDIHATGVDGAAIQNAVLGGGPFTPSVTATGANELALTITQSASNQNIFTPLAVTGALTYNGSACGNSAGLWQFTAQSPGTATVSNYTGNNVGNASALVLIKNAMGYTPFGNPMTGLGDMIYGASSSGAPGALTGPSTNGNWVPMDQVTASARVATSFVNLNTFLASPPAIGATAPAAGTFTTISANATKTTITGTTAGTAVWSYPNQGTAIRSMVIYLNGYENTTGTAQTVPASPGFSTVVYVVTDGGSCAGVTATAPTSTITLPSSMGATQTGLCEVRGY